ncbi:MAG: hypothetical protein IPK59_23045 [Rhodospirillaceae bacterium]|nr:hypothetical protein [Rhodospirillaceae bacterium]
MPPRILATQHVAVHDGIRLTLVVLDRPPVAVVSDVESIMNGWWYRAGGYPIGRIFGTLIAA